MPFDLPPCVEQVAEVYQLPVEALQAIHHNEGGWPGAVIGPNRNGTHDLGVMQINEIHLPTLAKHGISRDEVIHNACINISIGAWVYRQELDRFGDYQKAAAAYNAGPRNLKGGWKYSTKFIKKFRQLLSKKQNQVAMR